jgi:hypothetical protein
VRERIPRTDEITYRLCRLHRGEKDLRLTTLVKLANTFKIPVSQLFR